MSISEIRKAIYPRGERTADDKNAETAALEVIATFGRGKTGLPGDAVMVEREARRMGLPTGNTDTWHMMASHAIRQFLDENLVAMLSDLKGEEFTGILRKEIDRVFPTENRESGYTPLVLHGAKSSRATGVSTRNALTLTRDSTSRIEAFREILQNAGVRAGMQGSELRLFVEAQANRLEMVLETSLKLPQEIEQNLLRFATEEGAPPEYTSKEHVINAISYMASSGRLSAEEAFRDLAGRIVVGLQTLIEYSPGARPENINREILSISRIMESSIKAQQIFISRGLIDVDHFPLQGGLVSGIRQIDINPISIASIGMLGIPILSILEKVDTVSRFALMPLGMQLCNAIKGGDRTYAQSRMNALLQQTLRDLQVSEVPGVQENLLFAALADTARFGYGQAGIQFISSMTPKRNRYSEPSEQEVEEVFRNLISFSAKAVCPSEEKKEALSLLVPAFEQRFSIDALPFIQNLLGDIDNAQILLSDASIDAVVEFLREQRETREALIESPQEFSPGPASAGFGL